jgi:hypothetical protein
MFNGLRSNGRMPGDEHLQFWDGSVEDVEAMKAVVTLEAGSSGPAVGRAAKRSRGLVETTAQKVFREFKDAWFSEPRDALPMD